MSLATRLTTLAKPSGTPWRPERIIALDIARFLALIGMFAEHLLTTRHPGPFQEVVTGFPSTMFAVLGGVSVAITTRSLLTAGRPLAACVSVAVRGLIIAVIGLVLGAVPLIIVMVLAYYGVALVAVAFVLWLPTAVLVIMAAVLTVAGPHLILWARTTSPDGPVASPSFENPHDFLQTVFFTGFYPAITWITYLLIGLCAGRMLISGRRLAAVAVLIPGAVMAAAGFASDLLSRPAIVSALESVGMPSDKAGELVISQGYGTPLGAGWLAVLNATPHTGTTADVLRTAGTALVVLALLILILQRDSRPLALPVRVIAHAGSAPLTLYLGHFFGFYAVLGLSVLTKTEWLVTGPNAFVLHVLAALAIGAYLHATARRGPLEAFVSGRVHAVVRRLPLSA
ncbi:heparan-alpha-glucosaminide N-acetyltransferase domain-containing protein [Rathayibacter tritici]|uniref:Heparan-alpha-glucosaminide N-acetyltransferase catalytic domain-containing protein n=1 Tax=Rathayibacter tritici TaxID=33888 RepID=A0A169BRX5_9MICO|nr:heparan-alpha-glucosaminide N-acetyltransferase domain-containing protein [Rathayibacter tritici]AND15301.1 hypothetical protein A6122_0135 [Rathayibacter tritici]PPI47814.1 DUF1624 domain-containing protein [Rathayibacter tritici]